MLTNEFGFSVGGVHSRNYNIKVYDIQRNILGEITENLLNVPARKGAYFNGLQITHRVIQVVVNIVANSHEERLSYLDQIAYWLLDVNADQEIIFDDEPDKAYYGHIASSTAVSRGLYNGKATFEFHCSDPYKYSTSDTTISPDSTGLFTFQNNGSAETFPVFTTTFSKNSSFVSYVSPDGVVLIGTPPDLTKPSTPTSTTILNDNMKDIVNWTDAGQSALDPNRIDSGSAIQETDGIGAGSFGTGTVGANQWHGAAIRRNLPSTVQDFTVSVNLKLGSQNTTSSWDGSQLGSIDIYLYDTNSVKIGKLAMYDSTSSYEYNIPRIEFNNGDGLLDVRSTIPTPQKTTQKSYVYHTVVKGDTLSGIAQANKIKLSDLCTMNGISQNATITVGQKLKVLDTTVTKTVYPTTIGNYNDFYGQLSLQRVGTSWFAHVARLDRGLKACYQYKSFYDVTNKYSQAPLAYIVIHFGQLDTYTPCQIMEVTNVAVFQNNTIDPSTHNQTIFQAGDELEVDHTDSSVRLNGNLLMNQLDIGSEFFSIDSGTTEVKVLTDDTGATHSAIFTEKFI